MKLMLFITLLACVLFTGIALAKSSTAEVSSVVSERAAVLAELAAY